MFLFLILQIAHHQCSNKLIYALSTHFYYQNTVNNSRKIISGFILCFLKHKSVKMFDMHITWLVFISYMQQIHRVFKFLIWDVKWKSQFVFITKHVNANIVLFFNLGKIFFSHRKFNSILIKIINKLFVILCNSFRMYFYWINMPNMTP